MILSNTIITCASRECPHYGVCMATQFNGTYKPKLTSGISDMATVTTCESFERVGEGVEV